MSYRLELRKRAETDIDKVFHWYFYKSIPAAQKILNDLNDELVYLTKHPLTSAIRYKNIRLRPLKHFPVCIHYTIISKPKKVIVLAIIFSPEDPKKWDSIQ
jgi:toxin ParE1/3/4